MPLEIAEPTQASQLGTYFPKSVGNLVRARSDRQRVVRFDKKVIPSGSLLKVNVLIIIRKLEYGKASRDGMEVYPLSGLVLISSDCRALQYRISSGISVISKMKQL